MFAKQLRVAWKKKKSEHGTIGNLLSFTAVIIWKLLRLFFYLQGDYRGFPMIKRRRKKKKNLIHSTAYV